MGIFTKSTHKAKTCKLCDKVYDDSQFEDYKICTGCGLVMGSELKALQEAISDVQAKANEETDPDRKISYLRIMLDYLYKFKIKYIDNDVNPLEQDIDELIDELIDVISKVRL